MNILNRNYFVIHERRKKSLKNTMNTFSSAFPSNFDLMITLILHPCQYQLFIVEATWVPSRLKFFADEK